MFTDYTSFIDSASLYECQNAPTPAAWAPTPAIGAPTPAPTTPAAVASWQHSYGGGSVQTPASAPTPGVSSMYDGAGNVKYGSFYLWVQYYAY